MASNPPAACCASGFRHEGTPAGEIKDINGGKILIAAKTNPPWQP